MSRSARRHRATLRLGILRLCALPLPIEKSKSIQYSTLLPGRLKKEKDKKNLFSHFLLGWHVLWSVRLDQTPAAPTPEWEGQDGRTQLSVALCKRNAPSPRTLGFWTMDNGQWTMNRSTLCDLSSGHA